MLEAKALFQSLSRKQANIAIMLGKHSRTLLFCDKLVTLDSNYVNLYLFSQLKRIKVNYSIKECIRCSGTTKD